MKTYLAVIFLMGFAECYNKFTDQNFHLVKRLSSYLNSNWLVFVEDTPDISLVIGVRNSLRNCFYSSIINRHLFESILANNVSQLNFFQKRTAIVTKEELNLTQLLNKVLVPHLVVWMVLKDYSEYREVSYFPLSAKVMFVHSSREIVSVQQVYHSRPEIEQTIQTIWKWERKNRGDLSPFFTFDYKRNNFQNLSLTVHYLNHCSICNDTRGKLMMVKVECFHRRVMKLLEERLNFRTNEVEIMEKEHPFVYPNGTYSEIFVKLFNREVNFSAVSHVISAYKLARMDFIWPTTVLKPMMYLKQSRLTGHWTSYLRPLHRSIWWGIFIWILLTGFLLQVFEKLQLKQLNFSFSIFLDYINSVLRSMQVFCSQAVTDIPKFNSIRILYLLKLCVFVIFFQAYCGCLISSLTVSVPHYPFTDLKGFFENEDYQLMTIKKGFERYYFKKVIGQGRDEDFMVPDNHLPLTALEGVEKLCAGANLAFVDLKENMLDIDKFNCKIIKLSSPLANLFMGIALPKNSPYTKFLNRELIYFSEMGILQRMTSHFFSSLDIDDKKSPDDFVIVSITQVFSVFILFGIGILISFLIFIIELLTKRIRSANILQYRELEM